MDFIVFQRTMMAFGVYMPLITWNQELNKWTGTCPRCGMAGFFDVHGSQTYAGKQLDTLFCPAQHMFVVEFVHGGKQSIKGVYPVEVQASVPDWLPEEYKSVYAEMLDSYTRNRYRSMIACCGLLIEAHVNSIIKNPGDKRKSLFDRLEILKKLGTIDADQFSDASIIRITRKDVLHPGDILRDISHEDAKETLDSVISYLERTFKFRTSRALPPGKPGDNTDTEESK